MKTIVVRIIWRWLLIIISHHSSIVHAILILLHSTVVWLLLHLLSSKSHIRYEFGLLCRLLLLSWVCLLLLYRRAKWIRAGLNVCRSLIIEIKHTAVILIILLLSGSSQNSSSDVARSTALIEEVERIFFGCIIVVI